MVIQATGLVAWGSTELGRMVPWTLGAWGSVFFVFDQLYLTCYAQA